MKPHGMSEVYEDGQRVGWWKGFAWGAFAMGLAAFTLYQVMR